MAPLDRHRMEREAEITLARSAAPESISRDAEILVLGRQHQYLNDPDGQWRPHLMFFAPQTDPATWDAGLPGSPVLGVEDAEDHMTVFLIPVARWSDGTAGPSDHH